MKGILQYTEEPLVSTDLKGNTHSSIFSAMDTHDDRQRLVQGRLLVRQRVGLREPPRRHHGVRRGAPGGLIVKRSIRDLDVQGKTVLVRVDYNVPLDDEGHVADATRIEATLPTISYLREHGAKIVLMAHFGRPKGKVDPKYSLEAGRRGAERAAGRRRCRWRRTRSGRRWSGMVKALQPGRGAAAGERPLPRRGGEERPGVRRSSPSLGDLYVNDAFGAAHRAHASTAGHRAATCRRRPAS